ncbi:MAG: carboxypeptidase-like regulatory domain-containing protein [Bacteroidia bacterium]|nr:carboxypeptidase-like regulatory domain-containing protein [Bacteroidia bacterium]
MVRMLANRILLGIICWALPCVALFAQHGNLKGTLQDKQTGETIIGGNVFIIGTYKGAVTNENGAYQITDIKPGEYSIRFSYVGYTEQIINGVKIMAGQTVTLNAAITSAEITLNTVEILGEKNLVDLESGKSEAKIGSEEIKDMNVTNVQSIATLQTGVTKTPDGLQIRGGRVYETQYVVDGVNAQDPLAGTGFGVDIAKNAIQEVSITTGGADAEFGDGTSGIIITKTREGGSKFTLSGNYARDNLGFNIHQGPSWNTEQGSIAFGGPILLKKEKEPDKHSAKREPILSFFASGNAALSDDFTRFTANQLHSSLLTNTTAWCPKQDNRWSGTLKFTWRVRPGTKISFSQQQSLNINQNTRSLQIIGNDAIMLPGFQWAFAQNLDNANTYTHKSSLTVLNITHLLREKWTLDATVGRLFTNLRVDANGRPFRYETINQLYDPASIVTNPISLFNPNDSVVYVNPGSGFYNNNGIATLWHDHYAQEYTIKAKITWNPSKVHFLSWGIEHREQEYQWIDVTRPWLGAPIRVNDSTVFSSNRIGQSNDIWKANPATGGIFFQDEIRYKGIIAFLGMRFTYWAPGKFADNAVADPNAPVLQQIRDLYTEQSTPFAGRRFKARLLPKIRVSFPVTENNVLYFNYSHSTRLPHPRFVYAGLDPVYQNRSYLANLGNPNLNPETTVAYEVGIKSQLSANWALTFTAFYNDKFDFIVNSKVTIRDQSGRFVDKAFSINQDYARVRGLELTIQRRWGKWLKATLSTSYQVATGKSNTALESLLQIKSNSSTLIKEQYLAWDRPWDIKAMAVIKPDSNFSIFGLKIRNVRIFITSTYKSGLRYTPVNLAGYESNGRPIYEVEYSKPLSKIGSPWMWTDIRVTKDFFFTKKKNNISLFVELKNIFNQQNAAIVNPVTGRGYTTGDDITNDLRDIRYPNPLDRGMLPDNPARFLEPRQLMLGVGFGF